MQWEPRVKGHVTGYKFCRRTVSTTVSCLTIYVNAIQYGRAMLSVGKNSYTFEVKHFCYIYEFGQFFHTSTYQ